MPTTAEANRKANAYRWMISKIMEEKEEAAIERLKELNSVLPGLKNVYNEYQRLYNVHLKPLAPDASLYVDFMFEVRKLEEFLQGQKDRREKFTKLPYANKSMVGRKIEPLTQEQINLKILKQLPPEQLAKLLEAVNK